MAKKRIGIKRDIISGTRSLTVNSIVVLRGRDAEQLAELIEADRTHLNNGEKRIAMDMLMNPNRA